VRGAHYRSFLRNLVGIVDQGKLFRVWGTQRDITDHKKLEEQLRQAQKMEAIGRLAGGVAHDFNNLLTVINGYSELVLEAVDRYDELVRPLVAEIHQAGARAAALTGQLLAFSRQQIVQPRPVDLNGLVSDLQRMLSRVIGEDIELTTTLRPGLDRVSADPAQLEQVILNLAVNARDAMPQGGRLTVRTENVHLKDGFAEDFSGDLSEVLPGPYVRLSVSDTGRGMTAETLTHLFEPFFTTKESGQGTGLGLATVYGIVKQFGGHVRVQSELERGSTFEIHLPALPRQSASHDSPADRQPPPRGSETILLVEDEDGVRAVATRMLRQLGYNVLAAADGPQALKLVGQQPGPIDLLLTDIVMPGMNGRQVAERIRAARADVKVLYMSGYTDDAILRHGISESEVAFVQKPFSMAMLARRVREILDAPVPV
jgi:signal transduction histidine kinase